MMYEAIPRCEYHHATNLERAQLVGFWKKDLQLTLLIEQQESRAQANWS